MVSEKLAEASSFPSDKLCIEIMYINNGLRLLSPSFIWLSFKIFFLFKKNLDYLGFIGQNRQNF